MSIALIVTHRGERRTLSVDEGGTLMTALRDAGLGVDGLCGGFCACGTCHVYVPSPWADRLPPVNGGEREMLDALVESADVRPVSRLACQIDLTPVLDGLAVEVAAAGT